jgi:aminopeptidase N
MTASGFFFALFFQKRNPRSSSLGIGFASLALLLAVALALAPSVSADTYPRQAGVDALHYVFRLALLTDDSPEIRGEATVTLKFITPGVREAWLDLATSTAAGKGMTVTAVNRGGHATPFTHQNNRLTLTLAEPPKAGEEVSFDVQYHGAPANGLRLINNIHGERTAFSENWSNQARQWLPMIDHPYDKATGEFIVTTSSNYQVVANGALVEERDLPNGLRRTHWRQSIPIASWLYALGVARFAVKYAGMSHGIPLEYWVFPQDAENAYALFDRDARASFEFFNERVGPYAYEKLAHVQAAGMGGGTEHASNIFYGEKGIAAGNGPVVHETAHQWFGDAITEKDWDDVWLSEGFATYFTLLFTEYSRGRDAFVDGLRASRRTVLRIEQQSPNTPVVHRNLDEKTQAVLNQFVYQKGGWTLHMLRRLIGTETFWTGIRNYYRRYMNANASTDDFRQVMEQASGQDLRWFFTQWLNRSGVPKVEGSWHYNAERKQIEVTLSQTQTGDPFRLPIEIEIETPPNVPPRDNEKVTLTDRTATFTFPSDVAPVNLTIDPDTWLLAEFGSFVKK